MKFGVLQFFSWPERRVPLETVYARAFDRIKIMDETGYDAVWLAEHHFSSFSICPSIHMMGVEIAARTKNLRIGTAVSLAPFYHPLRLAEEVALLDVLSGGRVNWGAGRGYQMTEFQAFAVAPEESYPRFRENVQIVIEAWTQERVSFKGRFWQFDDVEVLPKPAQKPHPPVWLAASSAEAINWAGENGFSIMMDPHSSHAQIGEKRTFYRDALTRHGFTLAGRDVPMARLLAVARTHEEAQRIAREGAIWTVQSHKKPGLQGVQVASELNRKHFSVPDIAQGGSDDAVERYLNGVILYGTPDEVTDEILRLREEIGLDYLLCAPLSHSSFVMFTDEVLPGSARDTVTHTDANVRLDGYLANPRRGMWAMALPMMAGMSLHTVYMIADLIFVGMLGPNELKAVAFDMPLVFLGLGVTFGLGSGVTAVVARYVGARDPAGADRAAQNGLLMGLGLTAIFTILGGVWGHELLASMGVPADLLPIAWDFFGPIVYGYLFLVLSVFFRSILAGEGDMRTPMMIQGASTLLNIALDPIFMFTFGLGVRGAAYATVLAQAAAALTFVWMLYRKGRSYVRFDPRRFRPSAQLLGDIARIGSPASFSFLIMAVSSGYFNRLLVEYSADVVAAYQVGGRLDHVVMLPMISISTALVAMVAMFRGAERMDLVRDLVNYSMRWSIGLGAAMAILFFAAAPVMMRGFSDEPAIIVAGTSYLRYIVWSYPFVAISMLASRILQGLGIGSPALLLTVMRVLLLAAPLAWVLVYWVRAPVEGVWISMLVGVLLTAIVSMVWLRFGLGRAERGAHGAVMEAAAAEQVAPVG